ncbi:MAG: hypothetical protein HYX61_09375 [Gammaproteobacteria bacterium]|nr:hypothetical protein [Gammaproteobacteria bacterium]
MLGLPRFLAEPVFFFAGFLAFASAGLVALRFFVAFRALGAADLALVATFPF